MSLRRSVDKVLSVDWIQTVVDNVRRYQLKSLIVRYAAVISLAILIPLMAVLLVTFSVSRQITSEEVRSYHDEALSKLSASIESQLSSSTLITNYLFSQIDLAERFELRIQDPYEQYLLSVDTSGRMADFAANIGFSGHILLLDNENQRYYSSRNESGRYTDKHMLFDQRRILSQNRRWQSLNDLNDETFLTYYETVGKLTIMIEIPITYLQNVAKGSLTEPYGLLIRDAADNPIMESSDYQAFMANQGEVTVSYYQSETYGLIYTLVRPTSSYATHYERLLSWLTVLFIISGLFVILLSLFVTVRIFKPIGYLTALIQKSKQTINWHQGSAEPHAVDEIQFIARSIEQQNESAQLELQQRLAELKHAQALALQKQIDAHFLFNSLENINWDVLTTIGENNGISPRIETLAALLRLGLDNTRSVIPLKDELQHAQLYLRMQHFRYESQFEVDWNVDISLMNCMVLKLSMQPVLENIFKHAMRKHDVLTIQIRGYQLKNFLYIEVTDNGPGLEEADLKQINQQLSAYVPDVSEHIGLSNLSRRLRILYGYSDGLAIESIKGNFTRVLVKHPIKRESTAESDGGSE